MNIEEAYPVLSNDAEIQAISVVWGALTRERGGVRLDKAARLRALRWALAKAEAEEASDGR